jgi:hypothetical protein
MSDSSGDEDPEAATATTAAKKKAPPAASKKSKVAATTTKRKKREVYDFEIMADQLPEWYREEEEEEEEVNIELSKQSIIPFFKRDCMHLFSISESDRQPIFSALFSRCCYPSPLRRPLCPPSTSV